MYLTFHFKVILLILDINATANHLYLIECKIAYLLLYNVPQDRERDVPASLI